MHDEVLKFLTWLRDEKKIVLCRALGDNFFNEYVSLYVTLEDLLKEYRHAYLQQIQQWADAYNKEKPLMTPEEFKALLDSIED